MIAVLVLQDTVPSVAALQINGDYEERAEGTRTNGVGCIRPTSEALQAIVVDEATFPQRSHSSCGVLCGTFQTTQHYREEVAGKVTQAQGSG